MDNNWTPGSGSKKSHRTKGSGIDDLIGDLLDDDIPKKKVTSNASPSLKSNKRQSSRDDDFYSNLAATAEDDLSDVSEADVNQVAKSIADLEDMDADLFGGSIKKKGSVKGGSERSSKPNTPRRGSTPRSARNTTPRATSPQARVTSPLGKSPGPANRGVSPATHVSPPPRADTPTSPTGITTGMTRTGSGKRRTAAAADSRSMSPTPIPDFKPSSAPGKMTDIGSASEALRPGVHSAERPGTVPKVKAKFDFGEFNEDDPLAGLLSDEEDSGSWAAKPKKSVLKKQKSVTVETHSSPDTEPVEPPRRSVYDRPPTRSGGGNKAAEIEEPPMPGSPRKEDPVPTKKDDATTGRKDPVVTSRRKSDAGLFSDDDDDLLGGLGIDDVKPAAHAVQTRSLMDDDNGQPAKSIFDKLLGKDTVSKHLDTGKERREFVLDKKYTKNADDDDDFMFGAYQPSAVSTPGSRPNSRRSVRFQDEDDIFGLSERPPSRGRSPANKDTDWLDMTASKPVAGRMATPGEKSAMKPSTPSDTFTPGKRETAKPASKAKSDPLDWLEKLRQDNMADDPAYMADIPISPPSEPSDLESKKSSTADASQTSETKQDGWLDLDSKGNDYLGLGKEIDPDTLLGSSTREPSFAGASKSTEDKMADLFSAGPPKSETSGPVFERESKPTDKPTGPQKVAAQEEVMLSLGSPRVPLTSQIGQLGKLDMTTENKTDFFDLPKQRSPDTAVQTDFFSFDKGPKDSLPATVLDQQGKQQQLHTPAQPPAQHQDQQTVSQQQQEKAILQQRLQQTTGIQQQETASQQQQRPSQQRAAAELQQQMILQQQEQRSAIQQQQFLQQQVKLQQMMSDLQEQYEDSRKVHPLVSGVVPEIGIAPGMGLAVGGSVILTDPPRSVMEAEAKIRKLEIERDYLQSILDSTKRRSEEEIQAVEDSYKSRLKHIEESHRSIVDRHREENDHMLSQHMVRIRNLEEDKASMNSQHYRRMEELERDRVEEVDKVKQSHRNTLDQLKQDHNDSIQRLKQVKDQQIEAAATSHDATKSLVAAVELIQNNARDLGDLQMKVDSWHSQGLDEREITMRSKDEQLRILQQRLTKQQEDNELERQRLTDLTNRLETQLHEQHRQVDEEKWKAKQEQNRLQSLQTAVGDERRLWTEQQARDRSNIERTRESLLEDEKSLLSQLHLERQSLAEERMQFTVSQQIQKDETEQYTMKLAHAKAEYEATMKAISSEKNKTFERRQELQTIEDRVREDQRKLEREEDRWQAKQEEFEYTAATLKGKSEEVDEMFMEAQKKFDEGEQNLLEARSLEAEDKMRMDSIQEQIHILRIKEKEIAEERLRLSKDKKEVENLRFTLLCPNCRTPRGDGINVPQVSPWPNYTAPPPAVNGYSGVTAPVMASHPIPSPAVQMSLNSVQSITETIKADRSVRMWKMEAMKDQKYLDDQNMFLYALRQMPYNKYPSNSE